ncbi:MAG TPA: hypothetical protein EYN66_09110 [Myxococcales bacterium]|nr:hypothetical protein [Myxococcales bacterium]
MFTVRVVLILAIFALIAPLAGCSSAMIPGHRVADTVANREIYDVVEAVRVAIEQRDSEKIKALCSQKYFENASTTNQDKDDYGYTSLVDKVLPKLSGNIKKIQYRIKLKKIVIKNNRALAEYEYFWKFLYTEGGRENWSSRNDFNRLSLIREDGAWKIVAGL